MKTYAVVGCLILGLNLFGEVLVWNGGDGDLLDAQKWNPVFVPGAASTNRFSSAGTFSITASGNLIVERVEFSSVSGGSATIDLGAGRTWLANGQFRFGRSAAGTTPYSFLLKSGVLSGAKGMNVGETRTDHSFSMTGPDSRLFAGTNQTFEVNGRTNRFELSDGAYFEGTFLLNGAGSVSSAIRGTGSFANLLWFPAAGGQHPTKGMLAVSGSGNFMRISESAVVRMQPTSSAACGLSIGAAPGNVTNTVLIDGGAVVTNTGLTLIDQGYQNQMGAGSANRLLVSNAVYWAAGTVYVGDYWNGTNKLSISGGNGFVAAGGAQVTIPQVEIGYGTISPGNFMEITGAGTVVMPTSAKTMTIGSRGSDSRLTVSDGALLRHAITLGSAVSASNNTVEITGAGTVVSNFNENGFNVVGGSSVGNRLFVSNGAVVCSGFIIGNDLAASNNLMVVEGTGTIVQAARIDSHPTTVSFGVGQKTRGNQLVVRNGAFLYVATTNAASQGNALFIGGGSNAWYNSVVIQNGAVVSNANHVRIGSYMDGNGNIMVGGSCNSLAVSNAVYYGKYVYVGNAPGYGTSCVDPASYGNRFIAANGAQVFVENITLGHDKRVSQSEMVVSGPATRVQTGVLWVGAAGFDSLARVEDGAVMTLSAQAEIAPYGGSNNTLRIENATVALTNSYLSFRGGTNNMIQIAGTNGTLVVNSFLLADQKAGARLRFDIPKNGRTSGPAVQMSGSFYLDSTARLIVNAEDWALRTGGRIVLLSCSGTNGDSLANLVARAEKQSDTYSVLAEGTNLVLSSPRKGGTKLILR